MSNTVHNAILILYSPIILEMWIIEIYDNAGCTYREATRFIHCNIQIDLIQTCFSSTTTTHSTFQTPNLACEWIVKVNAFGRGRNCYIDVRFHYRWPQNGKYHYYFVYMFVRIGNSSIMLYFHWILLIIA